MDKFKLEYVMKSKGISKQEMCKMLQMSRSAFHRKCNGTSEFTIGEVQKIINILEIENPMEIFFADRVS